MSLSKGPPRSLSSREIAWVISGQLGALAAFCDPDEIAAALDHFQEFRVTYMSLWRSAHSGDFPGMAAQIERLKGVST